MSRSAELFKTTALLMVGKLFTQLVAFILVPVYTFHLAAEDYGTIDLLLTYIALIAPLVSIQLELAAFRFAIDARDDPQKMNAVLTTAFSVAIPVIALTVVAAMILSTFIAMPHITLIVTNILLAVVVSILLQFARGAGYTKHFTIASIVIGLVNALLSYILIVTLQTSAIGLMIALSVANFVGVFYIAWLILRKSGKAIMRSRPDASLRVDMLRYSIPLIPNSIAWWVLNVSDRTIIAIFIGAAANGIYAVASRFAFVPGVVFGILNTAWSESASIYINAPDRDHFFSKISDINLRIYAFVTVMYMLLIGIFYDHIIGPGYTESRLLIPILAIGAIFQATLGNYSAVYIAKKRTKDIARSSIIAALINIIINLALINLIGVYAAAISTVVAFAIMTAIRHTQVQQYAKINYRTSSILWATAVVTMGCVLYYINLPMPVSVILYIAVGLIILLGSRDILTFIASYGVRMLRR